MSKHTPGPWQAFTIHSTSTNPNCAYLLAGPKTRLMDRSVGFTKEDAELIAAAPDLLEALEGALDYFERIDDPRYIAACAAIARAKGEQP